MRRWPTSCPQGENSCPWVSAAQSPSSRCSPLAAWRLPGLPWVCSANFRAFLFHSVALCPLKAVETSQSLEDTPHIMYRNRKTTAESTEYNENVTKLIRYQCIGIIFAQLSQLQPKLDFYLQFWRISTNLNHLQKIFLCFFGSKQHPNHKHYTVLIHRKPWKRSQCCTTTEKCR